MNKQTSQHIHHVLSNLEGGKRDGDTDHDHKTLYLAEDNSVEHKVIFHSSYSN